MNRRLYWKDQALMIVVQMTGLTLACMYLLGLGLDILQIFPLAFVYLSSFFIWHGVRYHKKRNYFRKMAEMITQMDEKYLFPQVWKDANSFEEAAYFCLLKECTKSMLENVRMAENEKKEYQEWMETFVHDMKQPLAVLKLICERNKSKDRRAELLELESMNHYLEQVLYYGRSDNLRLDFLVREVDILETVRECMSMNKQLLIQGKFTLEIPDGIPLVYTDDKGLLFVLNQIVHNAAAYADEKPAALSIRSTVDGNLLHLHIRDRGCGIPPQDLPRVFDKGFTGCNGRKNRRSTGIGLYLSQKICRRMEADIQVKSQLGMFTEVVLTFRRKIADE